MDKYTYVGPKAVWGPAPRLERIALKLRAVLPGVAVLAVGAFLLAPSVASAAIRIDDLVVQEGDSSHPVALRVADDGPSTTTRCVRAYASLASGNESVNAGNKGLAYNNQDFVFPPTSESLCLAPGQTEGSIPLTVLGDTTREADELLAIGLSAGPGGPVEFADDSAIVTLLNEDGSTVSACILFAESRLGFSVKSTATSLKQLGILRLLSAGRKSVGNVLFCGNSKIAVTVRYGRAVVAKGVTQGKYDHYVPVHGGVHLARTRKTGRLKGLQRARLKVTVRIWDSEGDSIAGSRKVKIGLRGSGGSTPGAPR
jgi:hypothetical protein